jgi:hypothetical protein
MKNEKVSYCCQYQQCEIPPWEVYTEWNTPPEKSTPSEIPPWEVYTEWNITCDIALL